MDAFCLFYTKKGTNNKIMRNCVACSAIYMSNRLRIDSLSGFFEWWETQSLSDISASTLALNHMSGPPLAPSHFWPFFFFNEKTKKITLFSKFRFYYIYADWLIRWYYHANKQHGMWPSQRRRSTIYVVPVFSNIFISIKIDVSILGKIFFSIAINYFKNFINNNLNWDNFYYWGIKSIILFYND